ncbi:MAG: hypothetical protein AAFN79_15270 [Pseudomonadota bacterium]
MTPQSQDRSRRRATSDAEPPSVSRLRDGALILPIAGLALFCPPLLALFASDLSLFGAPLIVCYVFAVWAALIILARRLARLLAQFHGGGRQDIDL